MHRLIRHTYSFVQSHRWLVLGVWGVVLVAALPFAARQSDHLSGGGFTVPGSGSLAVDKELRHDFPRFERSPVDASVRRRAVRMRDGERSLLGRCADEGPATPVGPGPAGDRVCRDLLLRRPANRGYLLAFD